MFPAEALEKAVRQEIADAIADRVVPREPWEAEVDSLVMVNVVCRVEEEINIKLPDDVMPAGGFDDVDHCVATILEKCAEVWQTSTAAKQEV